MDNVLKKLAGLTSDASNLGLELIVIGGATRDWYLFKKESLDIDIEVHPIKKNENESTFISNVKKLCELYKAKELPFGIYSLNIENLQVEISVARKEIFLEGESGHSNFRVEFSTEKNFEKLWKRRDLSINAIGFRLTDNSLIDPLNGISDGAKKVLRPCDPQVFYKDYVRLFRCVRFCLTTGFAIDQMILSNIPRFDLSKVSLFHLIKESLKAGDFFEFFEKINEVLIVYRDNLSVDRNFLKLLSTVINHEKKAGINSIETLEKWIRLSNNR